MLIVVDILIGVGVVVIPNPCRHYTYHILTNTLLVYLFIYIKNQEHQFCCIYCIYKVNGGRRDRKYPEAWGPFIIGSPL